MRHVGTRSDPKDVASQEQFSGILASQIHSAASKATPADADELGIADSADSWGIKKLTLGNLKGALLSYFRGQFREKLTAVRTYYVRTDGNDANDGLSNSSAGAFATIQKAVDAVAILDNGGHDVSIIVAPGTYSTTTTLREFAGGGYCVIRGENANSSDTIISVAGGSCFQSVASTRSSKYRLRYMQLKTTSSGYGVVVYGGPNYVEIANLDFGSCASGQINVGTSSVVNAIGATYGVSGGGFYHIEVADGGAFLGSYANVTMSGNPNFSGAYVKASRNAVAQLYSSTFSGAAVGLRYVVDTGGVVFVNGAGATFLPGNSAGTAATGGQYA